MKRITRNGKRRMNNEKWRNISLFIFLVSFFTFFASCSQDELGETPAPRPEVGNQIKFEIGFAPQNDGKPQTRVATAPDFTSTWENGDAIGIFAVKRASSDTKALAPTDNYLHNVKLTYDGANWTPASDLWHASGSDVLDFYAYYPYQANVDPTDFAFAVKADQNGTEYNKSDLLMAKKANVAKSADAVSLEFAHALSLVQVEFVSGGRGAIIEDFTLFGTIYEKQITVTMKAIATTKPFALSATSIEATGTVSDIVMTKVNGLANTYRALVPAQSLAIDKTLFTVTRGDRLVYTTSAATTLAQAKAAKYKITLIAPTLDPSHVYAIGDCYPHVGLAEGIVYEISNGGKNGKIVSLEEGVNFPWSWTNKNTEASDMDNGIKNMRKVKEVINNPSYIFTNYPIFEFAHSLNLHYGIDPSGYTDAAAKHIWYLPAKNELKALYAGYSGLRYEDITGWGDNAAMPGNDEQTCKEARTAFNGKLTDAGGTALSSNYYWSSSEDDISDAWVVYFSDGSTYSDGKNRSSSLRAVSAF